jgi:hypothetical protein
LRPRPRHAGTCVAERLAEPVWQGVSAPGYFTAAEYAGGYDDVDLGALDVVVDDAVRVEVTLYYQTVSREYVVFLRDEINGSADSLPSPGVSGDPAYLIQTDPFFSKLKAWGDTLWQLWEHNKDLPGSAPARWWACTCCWRRLPVPWPSGVVADSVSRVTPARCLQLILMATSKLQNKSSKWGDTLDRAGWLRETALVVT